MLQRMQRRLQGEREGGFTLIELMVVVLIIAILIAIAIPTFLGARTRAQDRAAQSNLRNALTAEKSYYTDAQAYTTVTASLKDIEPSLTYNADAAPANNNEIYVSVASGAVTLGAKSASGTCFYIKDVPTGTGSGTFYGRSTASPCPAPSAHAGSTTLSSW
jgi:type IV pilus assembly protein PilA